MTRVNNDQNVYVNDRRFFIPRESWELVDLRKHESKDAKH